MRSIPPSRSSKVIRQLPDAETLHVGDTGSTGKGQGLDRGPGRAGGPERDAGHEKATEPKQKTPDFDMGL